MRVFELLLGFFALLLAMGLGYFAIYRVKLPHRKIKLLIGTILLTALAFAVMVFGFDL